MGGAEPGPGRVAVASRSAGPAVGRLGPELRGPAGDLGGGPVRRGDPPGDPPGLRRSRPPPGPRRPRGGRPGDGRPTRYLHLATHGYFAPPEVRSALAPEDDRTGLRSGRGWAAPRSRASIRGCSRAWSGPGPPARRIDPATGALDVGAGLMTAEEVGGLDLKGCELAVLSACETGLGRTAGGEGVLGLQRAFHQAGCRTVVASLWRVDDAATSALMSRFYYEPLGGEAAAAGGAAAGPARRSSTTPTSATAATPGSGPPGPSAATPAACRRLVRRRPGRRVQAVMASCGGSPWPPGAAPCWGPPAGSSPGSSRSPRSAGGSRTGSRTPTSPTGGPGRPRPRS